MYKIFLHIGIGIFGGVCNACRFNICRNFGDKSKANHKYAMIPLVPGVLIYQFLYCCIAIDYLSAEEFFQAVKLGFDATQILFAIAIGAVLPILIGTKIFDKKEQLQ